MSLVFVIFLIAVLSFINKTQAVQPSDFGLKEGDVISATGDPDVYIVNAYGYKRLFVNPQIFNLYGHLGWNKIKNVSPATRDAFITSGLFRNCESGDQKVFGLDVINEDVANLRWVNTSGAQAVADDTNFFKKVFCINTAEQRLYTPGLEYASVRQIPDYSRPGNGSGVTPRAELVVPNKIVAGYETTTLIKGSGFRQGVQVDFGAGTIKPSYVVVDDGQIKVTIPANMPALVYNIAITNTGGQSIVLKDALTIQQPAMATNSSIGLTAVQIFSKVSPSTALIKNNSNTTAGSGVVISSDGYILTNEHVISGYSTVKVYVSSTGNTPFTQYTGTILGQDSTNDLAIVKISASGLQPIEFGSSSETNLPGGSQIYAMGFPLVFNIGATSVKILDGIVVGRLGTSFIQVSANIQPGNSGGPLVNNQGQLVGINNWCVTETKLCQQGFGFAIPVDFINPLIAGLKSPRYTPPPTPPPTPLPTIPPTPTPIPTPVPTPSVTPTPSATPTPIPTPTPTPTPSVTPSPSVTPTPTPNPSAIGAALKKYVQPTGQDCDINVPTQYPKIQAGINAAVAGNTVCVGPGTYNENVIINKSIRLSGDGADRSIVNGQNTGATVYVAGDGNANDVIVEGFLIRGVDGTGLNDPAAFNIGPFASGVIVRHNWIVAGNAELAVRADSGQNNELIYNNVLEGNNSPNLFKIVGAQGPSNKVDFLNNTFMGTVNQTYPDSGIVLGTWATNSLIQRNVFNTTGIITALISSSYQSNIVSENNLNSSAAVKVGTYSGGTLTAENNWWGDLDPSDNVWGDIDFTPYATSPFSEN